jgi:hypothetical protein
VAEPQGKKKKKAKRIDSDEEEEPAKPAQSVQAKPKPAAPAPAKKPKVRVPTVCVRGAMLTMISVRLVSLTQPGHGQVVAPAASVTKPAAAPKKASVFVTKPAAAPHEAPTPSLPACLPPCPD